MIVGLSRLGRGTAAVEHKALRRSPRTMAAREGREGSAWHRDTRPDHRAAPLDGAGLRDDPWAADEHSSPARPELMGSSLVSIVIGQSVERDAARQKKGKTKLGRSSLSGGPHTLGVRAHRRPRDRSRGHAGLEADSWRLG